MVETPLSVALLAGGRWGKTEAEVRRMIRAMCNEPDLYYWVGLDWQSSSLKKAWRMLYGYWSGALVAAGFRPKDWINKVDHEIRAPNGSVLMFRTSKAPEGIAGDGPRGIVGDEYTYWPEEVWSRFIRPSLADKNGWAHLIGRPNGENWGLELWREAHHWNGWLARHYTIYDNPLLDRAVIEDLKEQTPDPVWRQEMMAEPDAGKHGVIPSEWIAAAQDRWRKWDAEGALRGGAHYIGVDVSDGGSDRTFAAVRWGSVITELVDLTPSQPGETMMTTGHVYARLQRDKGVAVVDSIGVGAGVASRLAEQGQSVVSFVASKGTPLRDKSGMFGFVNLRSAAWWHARDLLNPEFGDGIALPPDRELARELAAPRYEVRSGGKIAVESKDDGKGGGIRARLGRSPDRADAVIMALWADRSVMTGRLTA